DSYGTVSRSSIFQRAKVSRRMRAKSGRWNIDDLETVPYESTQNGWVFFACLTIIWMDFRPLLNHIIGFQEETK
ncbi:MAG: hypothetical protein L0287_25585, partial [Anaerolineae bacterium]|nr:hypothetical protein [Anaerolineae bacterium]